MHVGEHFLHFLRRVFLGDDTQCVEDRNAGPQERRHLTGEVHDFFGFDRTADVEVALVPRLLSRDHRWACTGSAARSAWCSSELLADDDVLDDFFHRRYVGLDHADCLGLQGAQTLSDRDLAGDFRRMTVDHALADLVGDGEDFIHTTRSK